MRDGETPVLHCSLSFDELGKHFLGIDGDEQTAASCQHFPLGIQDFRHVDVPPSANAYFAGFHAQCLVQRHRLQVVHCDL